MELPVNQILLGNCLELLRTLPDESVDAYISDVPYGLGNKDPSPEDIFMYVLGASMLQTGGDFMGRDWTIPPIAVWREVFRVLKPGAYAISFGGTRTFDLISVGLRMVGFESRDTISREFPAVDLPVLQWIQSQGMPKSHAIGKAIDKKLGHKRTKVVGVKPGHEEFAGRGNNSSVVNLAESGPHAEGFARPWMEDPEQVERYHSQLAPESEEAAKWEGWGSALKPSWEPILLFRKPFKGTLADNVLEYGTGGLNIDATRVRHASRADFEAHKAQVESIKERGGSRDKSWKNSSDLSGANDVKEGGRWPANVLLEHHPDCKQAGVQEIAPHPQGPDRFQKTSGGDFSESYGNQVASDEPEVIPVWECAEGCPVREMNEQSGDRPSTLTGRADPSKSHDHPGHELNPNSAFLGERTHLSRVYADGGGAARFFTQFESGCVEGCPVKALDDQSGVTRSGGDVKGTEPSAQTKAVYGDPSERTPHESYADAGGASRFFTQFDGEPKGRWPSNVVLQHAPECKRDGTRTVRGKQLSAGVMGGYGGSREGQYELGTGRVYDEPTEEDVWQCVEGCPVKALDQQGVEQGMHAAGNRGPTNHVKGNKVYEGGWTPLPDNPDYYADGTNASRFFSQFEGVPFKYVPKANRREAGCGEFEIQHITVKPLALMRWLVKLVTPKGGIVLDSYCGSGSTCHAAVLEGARFIGMELDPTSHAEAQRRLEIVLRQDAERREEEESHDFMMGRD